MNVFTIARRDLGAQFRQSRNLKETRTYKLWRAWWAVVYLAKAALIAVNSVRREQLGSSVIYKGRKCFVSNWAGSDYPTIAAKGFYKARVPRE